MLSPTLPRICCLSNPSFKILQVRVDLCAIDIADWQTVIKTFEKELLTDSSDALKPLERINANAEAAPDEVTQIVANRSGIILSASTILKSDFFSNLQKMSLPE
jgi:hypothetical protein